MADDQKALVRPAPAQEKLPTPEERVDRFKRFRWVSIPGAIFILALAALTFWNRLVAEWEKAFPQYFDALVYVNFRVYQPSGLPMFVQVDDTNPVDDMYCPVGYLLKISITSLQKQPATILDYEVSVRRPNAEWVRLPRIPWPENRPLYDTVELKNSAKFLTAPEPLDQQISRNSTLQPFSPITGTAIFADPFPAESEDDAFRVEVRDIQKHTFTSKPLHVAEVQAPTNGLALIAIPDKRLDLTKLRLVPTCPGAQ